MRDRCTEARAVSLTLAVSESAALVDEQRALRCPVCDGARWVKRPVPVGHPDFGQLFPCACAEAERAQRQALRLAELSNLGAFRELTFERFRADAGVVEAYRRAAAFARAPRGWLTLLGPYGCGKTHLAAAIANAVLRQGHPVLFVVVPDLLDDLRSSYAPDSAVRYDERFDAVRRAPLLVLDDLGTESATPWAREKLYQVVNWRYNQRLPTVFTSNLPLEGLDPRIVSRMHDPALPGELLTISAPDYRRRRRAVGS